MTSSTESEIKYISIELQIRHDFKYTLNKKDLWKRLCLQYHPDKSDNSNSLEITKLINSLKDNTVYISTRNKCINCVHVSVNNGLCYLCQPKKQCKTCKQDVTGIDCTKCTCSTCGSIKQGEYCFTCICKSCYEPKSNYNIYCTKCKCLKCNKLRLLGESYCKDCKCKQCSDETVKPYDLCKNHILTCTIEGCNNIRDKMYCSWHICQAGCEERTYGNNKYCHNHLCNNGGCINVKVNDLTCAKHTPKTICNHVFTKGVNKGSRCPSLAKVNGFCGKHGK